MHKKLYKMMNWPEIESVIYSDGDRPSSLLGAHRQGNGTLIQAFFPNVNGVSVVLSDGNKTPMELADEDGFYAVYVPDADPETISYHYEVTEKDGHRKEVEDCRRFQPLFTAADEKSFSSGIHYEVQKKLGAHPVTMDGCSGTSFAICVPNAARVSVIGSFNEWDGRMHQMDRFEDTDIFQIFIPGVEAGESYQFEVRSHSGQIIRKSDPYALCSGDAPAFASIVTAAGSFAWKDESFRKQVRARRKNDPVSIYAFHTASFSGFASAAAVLPAHIKDLGFNFCAFDPADADACSLFAPDRSSGTPAELRTLVSAFHEQGIGVFFRWNPVSFLKKENGLQGFAGTNWFEYPDPRKAETPDGKKLYFDLANPRVTDYLIANALYLIEECHADGLITTDIAPALYLDYGKQESGYTPNMYGETQNLEAVEFFRHLCSIIDKRDPGTILIAKETAQWPQVTETMENGGLGFTFKLHDSWKNDMLRYMSTDPLFREGSHELLLENMAYQYAEKYMLPMDPDTVGAGGSSLRAKMPGEDPQKESNLRLLAASMFTHPGAKLLSLGETRSDIRKDRLIKDLNNLYQTLPAMHQNDDRPDSFEWVRQIANKECMVCFLRKGSHPNDFAFIVANYAGAAWKAEIGVPYEGRYKEIFRSDSSVYGGPASSRLQSRMSKEGETDGRAQKITVDCPPLSLSIFTYSET